MNMSDAVCAFRRSGASDIIGIRRTSWSVPTAIVKLHGVADSLVWANNNAPFQPIADDFFVDDWEVVYAKPSKSSPTPDRSELDSTLDPDPTPAPASDPVNHPAHYNSHASGVECVTIAEHFGFNLGNVIKYIWRAEEKGAPIEDLKKSAWYLNREIQRREGTT